MNRRATQFILNLPRRYKRSLAVSLDVALCVLSVWIAYYLRLGMWLSFFDRRWNLPVAALVAVVFAVPLFVRFGLYRAIFRYAGWAAQMAVVRAIAIYTIIYAIRRPDDAVACCRDSEGDKRVRQTRECRSLQNCERAKIRGPIQSQGHTCGGVCRPRYLCE